MPRTLYLTTELPYFPGQAGVMALHIGQLSAQDVTGVVGPRYPHQPEDALQRLRDTVADSFWWPEHPQPGPYPAPALPHGEWRWVKFAPRWLKSRLLYQLAGIQRYSQDALAWRHVLVNLAPKILEALQTRRWNAVLLSQSTSAVWLSFLPASMASCIYFHDIRSDYLRRAPLGFARRDLRRILREERLATRGAEAIAFVSELDRRRAVSLLQPSGPTEVAPLCLDLEYFRPQPARPTPAPVVLFTGHLAHPPNVDAVVYFLDAIWPRIIAALPSARCKIVGAHPAAAVVAAVQAAGVELLANVPDIRPSFHEARVYVVPMRFGGGVRNKILEAWAMGVPVVTTSMGAEGIAARDGQNCWLRDEPESFAAQVAELLRNEVPPAVPSEARRYVEQQHAPAVSSPRLIAALQGAAARKRQLAPRVLYDLRWLQPGVVGGVEQMSHNLIDEIARFDRTTAYRFLGTRAACRRWAFPREFQQTTFCTDGPAARARAWRDAGIERLTSDLGEPRLTSPETRALEFYARLDFTVVHGLAGCVHPELRQFPSVVTMHDLQHLHLPQYFSAEDIATREREYRESCRCADHVICISEFTRQDVHRRYHVPLEKLTTLWNLPPRLAAAEAAPRARRRRLAGLGINHRYLFYPAQPWLHKNHLGLFQAIQLLGDHLPKDFKLVLTGQSFPAGHPASTLLDELTRQSRLLHLGYRPPEDIAALYAGAEAMIFPSLFEGFGMPVIESMQHGCPVVCGQHTSLPEIAGEAALFMDVASPMAMAEAILRVTGDPALASSLREKGAVNLERFNRRELAERHRSIYADVHQRHFS